MARKLIRISFLVFVLLSPGRFSFGKDTTKFPQLPMPTMPEVPQMQKSALEGITNTSAENMPAAGVPSIGDLMTVIDKATANNQDEQKNWSTPHLEPLRRMRMDQQFRLSLQLQDHQ